ncbi:hypothetical protein [Comamonas sp. GB3 AK4-5]|uniref:DUF4136 domain-containing protein n=1 Tax=Comamonas sp. GB3 AK4-5 TaxID=3231487 RepID=UPI00351E2461
MSHTLWIRRLGLAAASATALVLAGCASGPREITSHVTSYSTLAQLPAPPTYRLELLPSMTQQQSWAMVERQAEQSLQRVGLTRDETPGKAKLVVQIMAAASYGRASNWPYYGPPGPAWGWGLGYGGRWGGGFGMSWMDAPPMVYYRSVKLVMRDQQTQKIVYETSAAYDEVWTDDRVIYSVLFDAALSGFPQPPQGSRAVRATVQQLPADQAPSAGNATATEPKPGAAMPTPASTPAPAK